MKKIFFTAMMLVGVSLSASAQHDDLYFVPKKKTKTESAQTAVTEEKSASESEKALSVNTVSTKGLDIDEDTYNRRGSYITDQGDAVSEFAMSDDGFVVITEEGDTMWMNTDTLRLTRVAEEGRGWINGFEGSAADYEYAMRIIRFRNPRYAIPVSSPLYSEIVYGGAMWPSWEWNIYDDGLYAYVIPTSRNWDYWSYMTSPYSWGSYWPHYGLLWGGPWGHHWGMDGWLCYGGVWYDPWFNPYFPGAFGGYNPGWGVGLPIGGAGVGRPIWIGGGGKLSIRNDRHNEMASTRRGAQDNGGASRNVSSTSASRQGTSATRGESGASRSSSAVRVVTGRPGSSSDRTSGAVRTSSNRNGGGDEVMRRSSSPSSSISRGSASSSSSRESYARQSTSRSNNSGSSYNRPSSTRSSSSSAVSRSSSKSNSSFGGSSSSSSSYRSSSRSSSYSSSSSSYSSGSYSGGSSSSYSGGGSSYSSSSRGGGSYSGGSRSGGSSSGSRR